MKARRIQFPGFSLSAYENWVDITDSLHDDNAPCTVAKPEHGVGALQFSPALYRHGPVPSPSIVDLAAMITEFARSHELAEPFAKSTFSEAVAGAGASYRVGDEFIRVWYLSDGKNIMLVTYVCDWDRRHQEAEEAEGVVRSVEFAC